MGAGSLACTEHLAGILCARWNRSTHYMQTVPACRRLVVSVSAVLEIAGSFSPSANCERRTREAQMNSAGFGAVKLAVAAFLVFNLRYIRTNKHARGANLLNQTHAPCKIRTCLRVNQTNASLAEVTTTEECRPKQGLLYKVSKSERKTETEHSVQVQTFSPGDARGAVVFSTLQGLVSTARRIWRPFGHPGSVHHAGAGW